MNTDKDKMDWEVLSSVYLIKRPWLTARKDCVKLPNGIVNDEFYVLEYPEWVNVIAITKDGKMVLVHQYRHGIRKTCYELCAGVCEEGESFEKSARRELMEETGYGNGEWSEIMTISGNASTTSNYTHCFEARGVELLEAQHLDRTEDIEVCLFDPSEVFKMLQNDEIKQSLMAAPLWKYFYGENIK